MHCVPAETTRNQFRNYDAAIRLNPENAIARNNLGVAYLKLNKNKEGLAAFQRATTLDPRIGEIHVNLARAYLRLGNKDAAFAEYTSLRAHDAALAKSIYEDIFRARILNVRH